MFSSPESCENESYENLLVTWNIYFQDMHVCLKQLCLNLKVYEIMTVFLNFPQDPHNLAWKVIQAEYSDSITTVYPDSLILSFLLEKRG